MSYFAQSNKINNTLLVEMIIKIKHPKECLHNIGMKMSIQKILEKTLKINFIKIDKLIIKKKKD